MGELQFTGAAYRRGDAGYEAARTGAVANGRKPPRFPDLIVQAANAEDVVAAVRHARERGLKVGVRSGGHSWQGVFVRDGGVLIDLGALNDVTIDVAARRASFGPGIKGTVLNQRLIAEGLFFPSGHCMGVGLGGFLLQGGFGWNSRAWGPACVSVEAIDVVTAAGELVRADARQNSDLYWAARGAGPGFFGVVTRFHVVVQPKPAAMMNSTYLYPLALLDDVVRWAAEIQPKLSRRTEAMIFLRRGLFGHAPAGVMVGGPTLAETPEEARAALDLLETCPVRSRALFADTYEQTDFMKLMQGGEDLFYPPEARYSADNIWSDAPVEDLLPGVRAIAETLPPARAHMMLLLWGPVQDLPDMAFSMQGLRYVATYGVWDDPADDADRQRWVTERMRAMEGIAKGIQLADENLVARPARFMAEPNLRRLETLRAQWDPDGMFHSYMG